MSDLARDRFLGRINVDAAGCWIYRVQTTRLQIKGVSYTPRAAAHKLFRGEEPTGPLYSGATCSPNCVNPDHLVGAQPPVAPRSVVSALTAIERERFMREIRRGSGCWIYPRKRIQFGASSLPARRVAYELFKGWPATDHVTAMRGCDRFCVNPDHLLGSPAERLWHRVDKSTGCWLFNGPRCSMVHGKQVSNRALAYELVKGCAPSGHLYLASETCPHNCIHPDHQIVLRSHRRKLDAA